MKKAFPAIMVSGLLIIACSKSNDTTTTVDCTGSSKFFTTDINPIIQSYCATNSGCHGSGSFNGPGALTTYQQVYTNRAAIRTAVANGTMPQNSSLSASEKNALLCWIDNGASNN